MLVTVASTVALVASTASASLWKHIHMPNPPCEDPPTMGNSTFLQTTDHSNIFSSKFSQFYYWSDEFWKPGGPVILMTPGEVNATGYQSYLSINRTTGLTAQKIGAAVIVIEHRYWGMSSPFADLTTENMKYLTLENSIADLVHFAKTANLPFDPWHTSSPDKAPWILFGGSYSGALAAWTEATSPGTFWAYEASSAPVQSIADYWQYFYPVQEGMPKNCSSDINLVMNHLDAIGAKGTPAEQQAAKDLFGLGELTHYDDFTSALENGPWLWQGIQFYANSGFFKFCDAVEGVTNKSTSLPGAEGVGLDRALAGYADWFKKSLLPGFCADTYGYWTDPNSVACFDTHNASNPMFTDTSLSNTVDRQWLWFICNQAFGYWQDGAPSDYPTLVSRLSNLEWNLRQCPLYFPGIKPKGTAEDVNRYTKGWDNRTSTRLLYTNGQYDPWRESGVSADFRPGGPLQSTAQVPVLMVPQGIHCSDLITKNGNVNPGVRAVQNAQVDQLAKWVAEYPKRPFGLPGFSGLPFTA